MEWNCHKSFFNTRLSRKSGGIGGKFSLSLSIYEHFSSNLSESKNLHFYVEMKNKFFLFLTLFAFFVASRFPLVFPLFFLLFSSFSFFPPNLAYSCEHKKWFSNVPAENSSQLFFSFCSAECEYMYRNDFLIFTICFLLYFCTQFSSWFSFKQETENVNKNSMLFPPRFSIALNAGCRFDVFAL